MFTKFTLVALVYVSVLLGITSAAAISNVKRSPQVVPGPGMPSLESLGLTSRDLYKHTTIDTRDLFNPTKLFKRFDPTCNPGAACTIADAMACYNYLKNLGSTACKVNGWSVFCTAGDCSWDGNADGYATSSCSDVAKGGSWMFNHCEKDGKVNGANAAYGNGQLIVTINDKN